MALMHVIPTISCLLFLFCAKREIALALVSRCGTLRTGPGLLDLRRNGWR